MVSILIFNKGGTDVELHMVSILIFNKGGTDVEDVLNDAVDTPEEGLEQHKKQEEYLRQG